MTALVESPQGYSPKFLHCLRDEASPVRLPSRIGSAMTRNWAARIGPVCWAAIARGQPDEGHQQVRTSVDYIDQCVRYERTCDNGVDYYQLRNGVGGTTTDASAAAVLSGAANSVA